MRGMEVMQYHCTMNEMPKRVNIIWHSDRMEIVEAIDGKYSEKDIVKIDTGWSINLDALDEYDIKKIGELNQN